MYTRVNRIVLAVCLVLVAWSTASSEALAQAKVLYFTHEPGHWHKYGPQKAIFKDIAKKAGWDVTYSSGDHESQIKKLHTKDYGKGYDAIVYNFCFANDSDLESASNLMAQTREHGVPAMLIHCAMHSWWPTYKSGDAGALGSDYQGGAKAEPELVEAWNKSHPGETFPAWGDFTGIASVRHGPSQPITLTVIAKDHPITKRFPADGFTSGNSELYNNVYKADGVVPLIAGAQGDDKTVVMWICPQGKSQVIGFTFGHSPEDWNTEPFQNLVIDGVNYLIENPKP